MFGIEWLRNGMLVDKGSTALADEAAAVANARSRRLKSPRGTLSADRTAFV